MRRWILYSAAGDSSITKLMSTRSLVKPCSSSISFLFHTEKLDNDTQFSLDTIRSASIHFPYVPGFVSSVYLLLPDVKDYYWHPVTVRSCVATSFRLIYTIILDVLELFHVRNLHRLPAHRPGRVRPGQPRHPPIPATLPRFAVGKSLCAPKRASNPGALRLETATQARVNFREIGGPGVSGPGGIKKPPRRAA